MIDLDPIPFETKRRKTRAFVWVDEGEVFVLYRVNDQSATPVMARPAALRMAHAASVAREGIGDGPRR